MRDPRTYWASLSDEHLTAARDEYRDTGHDGLRRIADDIDDELVVRAEFRRRGGAV